LKGFFILMTGHACEPYIGVVSAGEKGIGMATDRSVPVKKGVLLADSGSVPDARSWWCFPADWDICGFHLPM